MSCLLMVKKEKINQMRVDIDEILEKIWEFIDWQHYSFDERRAKKYLLSLPIQAKRKEVWKEYIIIWAEEWSEMQEKAWRYDNLK